MRRNQALCLGLLLCAAAIVAEADMNGGMTRKISQKKGSKPCTWLTQFVQEPGCYYVEDIVMAEIIDKNKLTTWQAKHYYDWTRMSGMAADTCGGKKDQGSCASTSGVSCFWYVKGGNRNSPPGTPSCDLHPLAVDYNYFTNIKHACPGAPAIFDGKCVLEGGTKAKCQAIKVNGQACVWNPKRSFPCGAPAATFSKLTPKQQKLLPSYLDFNVGTSSQTDFEAVYGKCAKSLINFREQLCTSLDQKTCETHPTWKQWCIFEKATKQCQNRTTWWYGNGLGGDKHMTKVFADLEAGCKPIRNADQCSKFTYP